MNFGWASHCFSVLDLSSHTTAVIADCYQDHCLGQGFTVDVVFCTLVLHYRFVFRTFELHDINEHVKNVHNKLQSHV